ncbi:MAG: hypothetical protein JW715_06065 [Sedimentisphaerales bacterium]|nr:hypothetical protein [Sedimentisphaerales bacterium]
MEQIKNLIFVSFILVIGATQTNPAAAKSELKSSQLHVYQVNKKVTDFPEKDDFSTPESTYAVISRVMASGERGKWRQISIKSLADRLSAENAEKTEVKPEIARQWLNARIIEVRIFREKNAVVLAELTRDSEFQGIDKRYLEYENGRWLNRGQDSASDTIDEARAESNAAFAYLLEKPTRPKIDDPHAYLKPFVEFLKNEAREPKTFVMKALAEHKITIMGEIHHRPRYWAFNSSLVTEPDFPKHIGTIYLELPSNDQELVDKFLAADECDTMPVIEMLRDNLWMGWPDQAMLDFFITVWMVNQNLETNERLRIVLVDMQRPWSKIEKRQDFGKYAVNRDKFMAENIINDMNEHPQENRNALFIVGVGHTSLNQKYFEGAPVMTAGWYLRQKLGPENIYAVFQHRCVQTNMGDVKGRLCMGLFESTFAAVGNKPMAFTLEKGPFGTEPYDADPDRPVSSKYKDGFDAYLYLGPLETEIFSPLIAGFYTDDFVKELERRSQVMYGKGWAEAYGLEKSNAASFINWMSNSWGKPRQKWQANILGPLDAWHRGGKDWRQAIEDEKLACAMQNPEEVVQAAEKIFEKIREADYDFFLDPNNKYSWQKFGISYMVHTDYPSFVKWICTTFKSNPIVSVEVGEVFIGKKEIIGKTGWPTVPYKLTLKDGRILEGELPFNYSADGKGGHWHGMEGIDWHLTEKDKK